MKVTFFGSKGPEEVTPTDLGSTLALKSGTVWVDMTGPTEEDQQVMRDLFRFHPLAIEDTRNQMQRPKVDKYSDHFLAILNPATFESGNVAFRELDIFVGHNYIVTVHPENEPVVSEARKRVDHIGSASSVSPAYLFYVLIDVVVDNYFLILDSFGERIEKLEDWTLNRPSRESLNSLYLLRKTLQAFRQVIGPQRDMFNALTDALLGHELVYVDGKNLEFYLHDVADHVQKITDTVDTFSDSLRSTVDLYMSVTSYRLNQIVNRLTVVTVIMGVLSLISGFYGMNFERTWPPYSTPWGLMFAVALMASITSVVLLIFRKAGWY